jgi:flagellar basal-body rod protein FlgB
LDLDIGLLRLASALAAHASARQLVIGENIAHADTPGYRARDIEGFAETHAGTEPAFRARATRPGHLEFGADPNGYEAREVAALGAETPNGNSVSLEDQMVRAAEVRHSHELALGTYRKTLDILRSTIGGR